MRQACQSALEQALESTRRLLALVDAQEWEAAAKVEAERFSLLRQHVADTDPESLEQQIACLREIEILDREIVKRSKERKADLSRRLRDLHQGRKAGRAYGQESR